MPALQTLMSGIAFGESPRWREGRLWFCDWSAEELIAVDLEGNSEVIAHVASFPFSIDWLPGGTLLVVSARDRALLRLEPDGSLRDPRRSQRPRATDLRATRSSSTAAATHSSTAVGLT